MILEYKRSVGENVINQGLFYLDWLMDHQAEFKLLVMDMLGKEVADRIDWSAPRLICVAADFTKYDGHAVQQINRNIGLIRYRRVGDELLLLELANASSASAGKLAPGAKGMRPMKVTKATQEAPGAARTADTDKTLGEYLASMPEPLAVLLASLEGYVLSLGDDVQRKELKLYIAFKRLKNFATVVPQRGRLLLYLHLDVDQVSNHQAPGACGSCCSAQHLGKLSGRLDLLPNGPRQLTHPGPPAALEGVSRRGGFAFGGPGSGRPLPGLHLAYQRRLTCTSLGCPSCSHRVPPIVRLAHSRSLPCGRARPGATRHAHRRHRCSRSGAARRWPAS